MQPISVSCKAPFRSNLQKKTLVHWGSYWSNEAHARESVKLLMDNKRIIKQTLNEDNTIPTTEEIAFIDISAVSSNPLISILNIIKKNTGCFEIFN